MASIPSEHVVNVRAELDNAVVVRPGDKLVIAINRPIDQATANTIKERLAEKLPGVEAVIIDGTTGLAVYQPDQVERPRQPKGHPFGCKCAACF